VIAATTAGMAVMVVYVDPGSFRKLSSESSVASRRSSVKLSEEKSARGPAPVSGANPHPSRDADTVAAEIQALRARPVIVRQGLDLADQFRLAAGR
jgi:hypothetical protein